MASMKTLRLILGDQLNHQHSWFDSVDSEITFVMMEVRQETDYVPHHIQKVAGFFTAMRAFANEMKDKGHQFLYLELNDSENQQSIPGNIDRLIEKESFQRFEYQLPDEFRLDEQLNEYCQQLDIEWQAVDSEHFYTSREDLAGFFEGKKTYLMESFYRHMRKKHYVMMDGKDPVTGQWNYDKDNRKKLPDSVSIPDRNSRTNDVSEIVELIKSSEIKTIGAIDAKNFIWPTTRREALADLEIFCKRFLRNFGDYQDAMTTRTSFSFHSLLSFAMNVKLLSPKEVVNTVVDYWQENTDEIDISSVEGYVRQIIGWREYMRGIYWAKMPEYATLNHLDHTKKLPSWFWDANTKMNCLHHAIKQSLDHAYAHHIQRLMITGNLALLTGIDPDEVDKWYLGVYIDAIEWVEITNTRGMSQFADGGIVGTKPYVSSANYIDKMSDYCKECHYSKSKKTGDKACPFNSPYWNFYDQHRQTFEKNPRIGMMYRTWDKMDADKKEEILRQADDYLNHLNEL
ncbi:MAG TPA: cryptochrome/photolyase family protein [Cytophagales bacterium]|nr:cryptochrome/photolyase family protein [Cytophagales bacterium]